MNSDKLIFIILICFVLIGAGGTIYALISANYLVALFAWVPAIAFAELIGKARNGI